MGRVGWGVAVLGGRVLGAVGGVGGWVGGGAANLLGDEAGAKGGEVREHEVAGGVGGELGEGRGVVEVVEGEGGEDRDEDVVVGEVGVEGLV